MVEERRGVVAGDFFSSCSFLIGVPPMLLRRVKPALAHSSAKVAPHDSIASAFELREEDMIRCCCTQRVEGRVKDG